MKFLLVMESPEYLRFFDSTLALLLEQGHEIVLGVNEDKQKRKVRLEHFGGGHPALQSVGVVPVHEGLWGEIAEGLRGTVDFVRFLHPDYRDAPALRNRMKRKVLPVAFRPLSWLPPLPSPLLKGMLAFLSACERAVPVSRNVRTFLGSLNPDAVLVSPLVDAASVQVDYVKAARDRGIPSAALIASWDNLTNKGLLRIAPDLVVVWNEMQRSEAVRYHRVRPETVKATGAQGFDRWFEQRPTLSREAFCSRAGLPPDRPFIVFTGSSAFISEGTAEVAFVRRWIGALRASADARLRDVSVLVRPHPYNFAAWEGERLDGLGATAVWPRGPYSPIAVDNRAAYYDTLFHSSGVVGINTSAMVEAAIIGRPVFSMRTEEFRDTQEGTLHFHHLRVENGGCLSLAATMEEHLAQLGRGLDEPGRHAVQLQDFVRSFVRPHGLDRPATPILAKALVTLAATGRREPWRTPLWVWPLRTLVFGSALVTGTIGRLSNRRWRGRMRKSLSRRADALRKSRRRLMKRLRA